MKQFAVAVLLTFVPAVAGAWAPYEASQATTSEQQQQQAAPQTIAAYDPATIPLDYYDAVETEQSATTAGPLDAD